MVKITDDWIKQKRAFDQAMIECPKFDLSKMRKETKTNPQWVHLGGGNLYRCFHAKIAQDLLNEDLLSSGVIVADIFNQALIKQYENNDNRTLSVILKSDGTTKRELLASTAESHFFHPSEPADVQRMIEIFQQPSLQMVTVTITEKGYSVRGSDGKLTKAAQLDIKQGPIFDSLQTSMGKMAFLLYQRYQIGQYPLALVSTDNFSHNGQRFKESILTVANGWVKEASVEKGFIDYLENQQLLSFPFSMIDRITPLPSQQIAESLEKAGIQGMRFEKGCSFAPFVNTEETHYLVIEDSFPNGRPSLEKAGVYLTDRETVNKADLMKVCSCLNPLHTALAIFGCLFEYQYIWEEMEDDDLLALVKKIGYSESLPVVSDPHIIDPRNFLDEVIHKRFVNRAIPDTPQRIVTDTSQKLAIRYGETIKAYISSPSLNTKELCFIPLTIAAWCRYLLGVNDSGEEMLLSPDPLLEELRNQLKDIKLGNNIDPSAVRKSLGPILSNQQIFGVNLYDSLIGQKVEEFFLRLIRGSGAVRQTLSEELSMRKERFTH